MEIFSTGDLVSIVCMLNVLSLRFEVNYSLRTAAAYVSTFYVISTSHFFKNTKSDYLDIRIESEKDVVVQNSLNCIDATASAFYWKRISNRKCNWSFLLSPLLEWIVSS